MKDAKARTKVMAMLPDTLTPPGKKGISPIRLFTKMKKNTVSRYGANLLHCGPAQGLMRSSTR